ncbi:Hypothetical protein FKW44_007626 [Caligus rogercresseyi]|uniref:Uncharacterized protein n=1 Tax=Caligus rogercresseyi TaxID=217165 RepID=A0A7T8QTQ9_CALRO|nr:Hypothetical protein FKW44_007626 [Caligus rogercresseyi]
MDVSKVGEILHYKCWKLSFERKLTVLSRDIQCDTLSHFPTLRKFREAHPDINCDYLQSVIVEMQKNIWEQIYLVSKRKSDIAFPFHTPGD